MISHEMRTEVIDMITEATDSGARQSKACQIVGIAPSTLRRWQPKGLSKVLCDQRSVKKPAAPAHKLSEEERERILEVCNQPDYSHLPPSQIVPRLADQGEYIASESSFYRILKAHNQLHHRGRAKQRQSRQPTTHLATKPNDVWMLDVTYLPSRVIGKHYYLYMIEDLYSRYGVHWEVHDKESGDLVSQLVTQAVLKSGCGTNRPILHSDNGSPMKSFTMRAKLQSLGITPSYSRPRVSNDNAFIESMFRTVKYCPSWPSQGFIHLDEARAWVGKFMHWYNEQHRHSGIRFVTPGQRYRGEDDQILKNRVDVYEQARQNNPRRWSGDIRNWEPCQTVALNPEKTVKLAA